MKSPCKHPGCKALLDASGYCAKHAKANQQGRRLHSQLYDRWRRKGQPELAAAQELRSSSKWKRSRWLKLTMNPLCEDPFGIHARKGETVAAKQVHHIAPLSRRIDLGHHLENLMSVCPSCHSMVERQANREAEAAE